MNMTKIIVLDEVNKAKEKAKSLFPNSSVGISNKDGKYCLKINMPISSKMSMQYMPSEIEGIPVKYDFVGKNNSLDESLEASKAELNKRNPHDKKFLSPVKIRNDLDKNMLSEENVNKLLNLFNKDDEKISFIVEAANWDELANELSSVMSPNDIQRFKNIGYFSVNLTKEQLKNLSKNKYVHYIFPNRKHVLL